MDGQACMVELPFVTAVLGSGGESVLQSRIPKAMPNTSALTLAFMPAGAH